MTIVAHQGRSDAGPSRHLPRIAGAFYLLTFLTGVLALLAGGRLLVAGDAATTAVNIANHKDAFRLIVAAYVGNVATYLVVTWLLYELFSSVHRGLALCATFFSLVACAVQAAACAFPVATLVVLSGDGSFAGLPPRQLQALAMMFLKIHAQAYDVGLVFFGVYCVLIGRLILRSNFLPRLVAVLMMLGGCGWLTFLWPPLAHALSPYNLAAGVLGEGVLTLWLLFAGVNVARWQDLRAGELGASAPGA